MGNLISSLLSSPLATKICDGLQNFAANVYQLEDNLEALRKAAEDLRVMKKIVLRKIRNEKRHRMQTSEDVEQWLSRVEATTAKADRLKREGEQAVQRLCLGGICSTDYFSTSVFGGSVTKCLKDLQDLKVTGENFGEVVVEVPAEPESGTAKPCGPIVGLETKLNEVLCYLEEERAGIVGVYGQGGVGKTTLLKKINNHFVRKSGCFVIWIDVPNDLNLESIQQALGEKIGLPDELTDKSLELKSAYICKQLQRKKIILLLDDIKGAVDLSKIGVPPAESLNESRVVFTTREEQVCRQMDPQPEKSFSVETLEEEHAWQLFLMKAGQNTINSHPEIPRLAKTVVKKCGGLPLALTIIGKSMSCKREPKAWERAIKTFDGPAALQHSQDREHEYDISKIFLILRYSYDNLPSALVRSCFSYCALFPEGHEIPKQQLVELLIFEDFWIDIDDDDEIDSHYEEANCILSTLVRASLLEDKVRWVKMHDVIRSMALWISKGDALVMTGKQLKQAPRVGEWKAMKRVSLMENVIEELAQVPECPNLATLLLNDNIGLRQICHQFFQSMSNLTILSLSRTKVKELPGSISKLVSLTFLDISQTWIKSLPIELTLLKMLKYLDLCNLHLTFKRSEQVVRNLSSLRVLMMLCSYSYYEEEGCDGEGEGASNMLSDDETLLEELQYLEHLNLLEITIKSLSGLEKLFSTRKLLGNTRMLGLGYLKGQSSIDVSFLANTDRLSWFQIVRCNDMEELVVDTASSSHHISATLTDRSFSNITSMIVSWCANLRHLTCLVLMPNLEVLRVENCQELREIINEEKLDEVVGKGPNLQPFSNLTVILFIDLPQLESIYSIATLPFRFLHFLRVNGCPNLKKLPISSTSIMGCSQIELDADEDWWDAIEWEDDATNDALLSRFKLLPFVPKMKERGSSATDGGGKYDD